jgi:hypothetical protein
LTKLASAAATEVTIASGVAAISALFHKIDGEGDADDDLVTISGGAAGQLLFLIPENAARNITIKHGSGNIVTGDGYDYILPDNGLVILQYDGSNWRLVGGGGSSGHDIYDNGSLMTKRKGLNFIGFDLTDDSGNDETEVALPTTAYSASFTNASLSAGVLTVAHSLNTQYVSIVIIDNNSKQIIPDEITYTDANNAAVSLVSYGTISGTWNVIVLASGAGIGDYNGLTNPMTTAGDTIYGGTSGTPTRLAKGTAGQVIRQNSGETAPEWATIYRTAYIDAGAMVARTTNGAASGTTETSSNDVMLDYFAFDGGATEEAVQFKIAMPDDWDRGTLKFKFKWSSATGSTAGDTVEWGIRAVAVSNDDALDASWGTAVTVSDTLLANDGADMQISAPTGALTVGGSPALGDMVFFEVYRNTDGTDDMTEDAWLFGVQIQYIEKATQWAAW